MWPGIGVGDWQAKAVAHGGQGTMPPTTPLPHPTPRRQGVLEGLQVMQDSLNSECQGGAESEGEKERWSFEHQAKGFGHYEGQWEAMEGV